MSDLSIHTTPVLQRQPVLGTTQASDEAPAKAPACRPTEGRSVDSTTYAALAATELAPHLDPRADDVHTETRRMGDTYVRHMNQGALRVTEIRYPDGSGFLHVDKTLEERTVPGFIDTKTRTFDSETVRMQADGNVTVIGREAFGSERETMVEWKRFGIRFGLRERSAAQADVEFEGGLQSDALLRGKAGFVLEARQRKAGIYAHGSLGIANSVQYTTNGERDARTTVALPISPLSVDSRQVATEEYTEFGIGAGKNVSLGLGVEREIDFEALPLVQPDVVACDPGFDLPEVEREASPLDDIARRLGVPDDVSAGEHVSLEDIQRRLDSMPPVADPAPVDGGYEWSDFQDGRADDRGFVELD